jgi:hypothetical protein
MQSNELIRAPRVRRRARCVAPKRKVGLNPLLEHGAAALLEARDLGPGEVVVGEIGQRRPAPQREDREQLALSAAADDERPIAVSDLKWAK